MPPSHYPLPAHQPIVSLDDNEVGKGWRRVSVGESIKTHFEVYILMPPAGWRLSSFFSSDEQCVSGRAHYRAPASIGAWWSLIAPLAAKWWYRWTKTPSTL